MPKEATTLRPRRLSELSFGKDGNFNRHFIELSLVRRVAAAEMSYMRNLIAAALPYIHVRSGFDFLRGLSQRHLRHFYSEDGQACVVRFLFA